MLSSEAATTIARHRADALVVVTMTTIFTFPNSDTDDLTVRCAPLMGGASSIGLGLALARPERPVIVLDGDGSLLMQLGSLATIAGARASNLYHFVFNNGVLYEGGGRVPVANPTADFVSLARGAGYRSAERIDNPDDLDSRLPSLLSQDGPLLVDLAIDPPSSPPWSNENPHGELPDWWFTQMEDDARQVAARLRDDDLG